MPLEPAVTVGSTAPRAAARCWRWPISSGVPVSLVGLGEGLGTIGEPFDAEAFWAKGLFESPSSPRYFRFVPERAGADDAGAERSPPGAPLRERLLAFGL